MYTDEEIINDDLDVDYEEDLLGDEQKTNKQEEYIDYNYEDEEQVEVVIESEKQIDQKDNDQEIDYENEYEEEFENNVEEENSQISKQTNQNQNLNKYSQQQQSPTISNQSRVKRIKPPTIEYKIKQKETFEQKYQDILKEKDYQKLSIKALQNEEKELRKTLKEINEQVTKLVEESEKLNPIQNPNPKPPKPSKKQINKQNQQEQQEKEEQKVEQLQLKSNQTKLQQQQYELQRLQERIDKINSPEYLRELLDKIDNLKSMISKKEAKIKSFELESKKKGKILEKYQSDEGLEKKNVQKQQLQLEYTNILRVNEELGKKVEYAQQQYENLIQRLPGVQKEYSQLVEEAKLNGIEINDQKISSQQQEFERLSREKAKIISHKEILDKKKKSLKQYERDMKAYRDQLKDLDQQINQLQIDQMDVKRLNEELKQKYPEAFKNIPSSFTQDNIYQAMDQQTTQRKLQSAKPSNQNMKKSDPLQYKSDPNKKPPLQPQKEQGEQKQQQEQNKEYQPSFKPLDNTPQQQTQQKQVEEQPIVEEVKPSPQPQSKLNSKPFAIKKFSEQPQQQVNQISLQQLQQPQKNENLGQSQVSQQDSQQDANSQDYVPTRLVRMRKPRNLQEDTPQEQPKYDITKPDPVPQKQEAIPQIQQQKNEEIEYNFAPRQPGQNRRNRFNIQDQPVQQPEQQKEEQEQDPIKLQQSIPVPNYASHEPIKQPIQQPTQQPSQQQQEYQFTGGNEFSRRNRLRAPDVENQKDTQQPLEQKVNEQKIIEQKPIQQQQPIPGKLNNNRRNNNRLNLFDEQPQQKENLLDIPELKDGGREDSIKQEPPKEDREMTLDEILNGGSNTNEYQPTVQPQKKRIFQVPTDEYKPTTQDEPVIKKRERQSDLEKQKELAQKAEQQDLYNDFDF